MKSKITSTVLRKYMLKLVKLQTGKMLHKYHELAATKPRDTSITYCSGVSGEPYTTMVTLLVYSIILSEESIPLMRIGYDGKAPEHLRKFDFIELFQVQYETNDWPERTLKFWNFVGKPQSMLGAKTELSVWLDSDIFLLRSIRSLFTGNAFIPTDDRVGGGIYCLEQAIKEAFYCEVLASQKRFNIRSDRPCMQAAIDNLQLEYRALPDCDMEFMQLEQLRRNDSIRGQVDGRYWMHLSRGKTRNPFYVIVWARHILRLLAID